jgi:hypothetical protein
MFRSDIPFGCVLAAVVVLAGTTVDAHAQTALKPQDQAGRLLANMQDCGIERATTELVMKKVTDWYSHTKNGKNELSCTRDPKCGLAPEVTTAYLCARIPCDKSSPPPAVKPDCATFLPRFKAMKLLRDDWRPSDGLR